VDYVPHRDAGYPNGITLKICGTPLAGYGSDITDVESEQMKATGINLDVTMITGSACLQTFTSKKIFPAWQGSFSGRPDPFLTYQQNFGQNRHYALGKLAHPGVDALLDRILATDNTAEQKQFYTELNRAWIDNAPFILQFYRPNFAVYNKNVSGELPDLQGRSNLVTMFYKWPDRTKSRARPAASRAMSAHSPV
jgi:ABC-type transport system substrate-binding protein